jgi:hypothetical protein
VKLKSPARDRVCVVHCVHLEGEANLPIIVEATRSLCFAFRIGQGWQEHPGQNGNDGNDHEELD